MSVYKEAVWDAEVLGPGTHRSQQGSDVQAVALMCPPVVCLPPACILPDHAVSPPDGQVQRLQAELDAASAREQEPCMHARVLSPAHGCDAGGCVAAARPLHHGPPIALNS